MPEFALVAPILFLIIFGIFDMGHGIYDYVTLQTAANEAARVAVQGEPDLSNALPYSRMSISQVTAAARENTAGIALLPAPAADCGDPHNGPIPTIAALSNPGVPSKYIPVNTGYIWVTTTQTYPFVGGSCNAAGTFRITSNAPVQVTIVYHYSPITPLIGNVIGSHLFFPIYSVYLAE